VIVRLLEVAQCELDEAISYYNNEVPGLGDALLLETVAAIERIKRFPDAWHVLGKQIRRCYTAGRTTGATASNLY
jgi:hypothetical protein